MSQRIKKEPTNKEILTTVSQVQAEVGQLKSDVSELKTDVQNLGEHVHIFEVKTDERFDVLIGMVDSIAKKFQVVHDEQRAGFANYSRLDSTVEKHDKDIKIIKRHLSIA